jgi:galactokinase/mevalonate kinase-like predicted kinase
MKEFIVNYFNKLGPEIIVQSPSRINLINPLDAVEADFWMPSVAINGIGNPLSSFVFIKETNDHSKLKVFCLKENLGTFFINLDKEFDISEIKDSNFKNNEEILNLYNASVYRFGKTNKNFIHKYKQKHLEIGILTTIPRQSGLGGSASLIIAFLYAFAKYFNLLDNLKYSDGLNLPINRDILAEMAMRVEDFDLNITAGYSDRYVISRGGIAFCSYCGKLKHREISQEPLAVYDRIDELYQIKELPIIICYSGFHHNSGTVHSKLRDLYLKKDAFVQEKYFEISELSWKARYALMQHDWRLLGRYFKLNSEIMNMIMVYAGFKYGIGLANNFLIDLVKDHQDVYSVKLTGAGGGGSIFTLSEPSKIDLILSFWKKRLEEFVFSEDINIGSMNATNYFELKNQLNKTQFFKVRIDTSGVKELKEA